jgi:hypothetical protein
MSRRLVGTGLIAGFLMNAFGWLGNQLWLGKEWDAAIAGSAFAATRSRTLWNELASLVPDFIYGLVLAWLCALAARTLGRERRVAYGVALGLWAVAIATPLLGTANASFMPWRVTLLTSLLALVIMVPVSEFVWRRVVADRAAGSTGAAS